FEDILSGNLLQRMLRPLRSGLTQLLDFF
nr:Chain A, PlAMV replicase peptide from RNA-dependent RNA polymerase [Plantago asiatica mosaic virus]